MANAIELSFVNGLAGDPAVNIYFKQSGESLLFDAGHLESLSSRDILKIKVIAISHTHIDHFVGFDKIIRTNVPHFRTPEVVGPEGIIKNIQGKLAAYTWNLLDPDQVNFIVHEVKHDGSVTSVRLSNSNDFQAEILPISSPHARGKDSVVSIPLSHAPYMLSAVYVDHGMPVLAYRLQLPTALVVNKQELQASGLTPGPWISELQSRASRDDLTGVMAVDGINMSAKDLSATLLSPRQGDSVIYVTEDRKSVV
jgi:ribonuclease Z